jgi:hypothetical protein
MRTRHVIATYSIADDYITCGKCEWAGNAAEFAIHVKQMKKLGDRGEPENAWKNQSRITLKVK